MCRAQLAAENLFLRKQLALYRERRTKPRRPDPATRVALVLLLDWRPLLMVVKPDTLIRGHRQRWRLLWRWKPRPGRPLIPVDLRRLSQLRYDHQEARKHRRAVAEFSSYDDGPDQAGSPKAYVRGCRGQCEQRARKVSEIGNGT